MLSTYENRVTVRISHRQPLVRAALAAALLVLGFGLAGCADMSDSMTLAFADPAKYDLYECKQLETERKSLAARSAELQGLMAKADTGVAGPVVAELAYRNEYISVRGQTKLAEEAWLRNKCHETPANAAVVTVPPPPPANAKGARSSVRSGGVLH
jgi:hypothetical protein